MHLINIILHYPDQLARQFLESEETCRAAQVVLGYRKLSLSIIDNFAIFLVIELSIISAKIIDNSR
jgi:hypothetical protein